MKKTIFTCDHCGKEMDEMRDYSDMEFKDFYEYMYADLCSECYHELGDIVLQYISKNKDT